MARRVLAASSDLTGFQKPVRSTRLSQAAVVVLFLLLAALFLWRLWALNPADRHVFTNGDFVEQFYPLRRFAADELKAGRLPLWNPHIYAGTAALADPQWATLYPLAWPTAFLPPWPPLPFAALELEAGVHLALAGVFTVLFARRHLPPLAALLAGLVFAFGGYLTSYPPLQLAVLETAVWLPLVLWGAERLAEKRPPTADGGWRSSAVGGRWSAVGAAALPLALAFLAGHPQTFVLIAYTGVAYYVYCAWGRWPWRETVLRLVLWGVVTLGLTVAQWLPTVEFARVGPRLVLPYEEAAVGFTWPDVLHVILPGAWGPWSPLYVGGATLLLVLLGLRRPPRFWTVLAVVGLLLSLGEQGGLYWLAYHAAPGFSLFRHQERAAILWSFALAMLAGYGVARLLDDRPWTADDAVAEPVRRPSSIVYRLSSGTAWLGALPLALALVGVALTLLWARQGQPAGGRLALWSSLTMYAAAMTGLGALLMARVRRPVWAAGLVLLVGLDLFSTGGRGLTQAPPPAGYFAPNPIVWAIQADTDGLYRISSEGLLPPGGGNGAVIWSLDDVVGNSPLHLAAYDRFVANAPELVWWRLLGVRYVVTRRDLTHGALAEVERVGENRLYRVAGSLPRAWLAPGARVVSDEAAVLAALREPAFDPLAAVVSADPGLAALGFPATAAPLADAQVEIARPDPAHYTLTVETPAPALLVLSEASAPGWQAMVNGQTAPVFAVDGLLQAVPVPGGHSVVEWRYQPWTVRIGLVVSALTVIALTALWRYGPKRTRS